MGRSFLRWICFLLMVSFITLPSEAARRHQAKSAYKPKYAAIVMDADTGNVLESEDPDGLRHPASLTKMMTLYLVFDELRRGRLHLSTRMPVSAHASRQSPSKLGLQPGQTISVGEAIQALVTKSANDVAVVVSEYLAGSEPAFARRMTQKAQALGMRHTTFKNASGLPNPLQITTARDMATLSRSLYRDFPNYYTYFKQRQFVHQGIAHRNHNHLLGKVPGVDGIKTGFIGASGFNLAASAVRYDAANSPHRLIVVVLGGPNRHWRDRRVSELFETNFQRIGVSRGKNQWVETKYTTPENSREEIQEVSVRAKFGQLGESQNDHVTEVDVNEVLEDISQGSEVLSNANTTVKVTPVGWIQGKPEPAAPAKTTSPVKQPLKQIVKNVQVGTFHRHKDAQKAAKDFQRLAGQGVAKTTQAVVRKGKKTLYTAQVHQIAQEAVGKACQKWRSQGNQCLIK